MDETAASFDEQCGTIPLDGGESVDVYLERQCSKPGDDLHDVANVRFVTPGMTAIHFGFKAASLRVLAGFLEEYADLLDGV